MAASTNKKPMAFLAELKRRNVFRVGAAYIVLAWLLLQVADVILNNITAPAWIFHVILLLLGIGLLLALFFAWAFELTPEGLKREHEVDRTRSITPQTGKKLNRFTIVLLIMGLGYFSYDKFVLSESRDQALVEATTRAISEQAAADVASRESDKSIAVLPFVNMSSDPEQEYFSDGISEELLNVLAKIPDLHVTSRSSAFAFKGKDVNIQEIADTLGVAHVLEGSVRKSGVRVRITAQLIEADSDKHLWSDSYDRSLDDIFAVQDEISAAIVDALIAKLDLAIDEERPVSSIHSTNTDAYTSYLLGNQQLSKRTRESVAEARKFFQNAIEEDPGFAAAYAQLASVSLLEAAGYGDGSVTVEEGVAAALPLIEKALELDPEQSDAYAAKGLALRFEEKSSESIPVFQKALEINPSHSNARNWLSMSYRLLLQSRDELETLRIGHRHDPLAVSIATNLVKSLSRFERYDEAASVLQNLKLLGLANHGFSRSEALMLGGRYAESIDAALRGKDAEPQGSSLPLHTASYMLAAMGEIREAERVDPWQGNDAEHAMMLRAEIRDSVERLEALQLTDAEDSTRWTRYLLLWGYLGVRDFARAEEMALERLANLSLGNRDIDGSNLALAIIEWNKGDSEKALRYIAALEQVTAINLADGDNISLNHLIQAIAAYFRGDESATYDHLKDGFTNKAPMSFEGENVHAIYTALGWDGHSAYQGLMEDFETHNANELQEIFFSACNEPGYTVWTPLPDSCAAYAPLAREQ